MARSFPRALLWVVLLVRPVFAAGQVPPASLPPAETLVGQAIRYEFGEGLARDLVKAADLYCVAARMGNVEAMYRLGWMHSNGRGMPRDDGYAVALFQRAAAQGHEYAKRMLGLIASDNIRLPPCIAAPTLALAGQSDARQVQPVSPAVLAAAHAEAAKEDLLRAEQLAKEERSRAELARFEFATADQLARANRAGAEAAQADLAKAAQLAEAKLAKAEAAEAELAKAQQLAQAERSRAEAAKAELAKAEQLAQAERSKAELASAEAARTERQAQAEQTRALLARVDAAKKELARVAQLAEAEHSKAEPGQTQQQAQTDRFRTEAIKTEPDSTGSLRSGEEQSVSSAIAIWTNAWSRKDVEAYFAAYAKAFTTPGGRTRQQWERERRARIVGRAWISVAVDDLQISVEGNTARARFRQDYRSDLLTERESKTLTFVKVNQKWLIRQEQSGG